MNFQKNATLKHAVTGLALTALAGALSVPAAHAQQTYGATQYELYNTGVTVSPSGAILATDGTTPDSNYFLFSAPTAQAPLTIDHTLGSPVNPGPYVSSPDSEWVGPDYAPTTGDPPQYADFNGPAGTYIYQTSFDLSSLSSSQIAAATLTGEWATDNEGAYISINGTPTANTIPESLGFEQFTPFTISGSLLTSGTNTLQFVVTNDAFTPYTTNPTALNVTGLDISIAPEPAQMAVFAFVGLGLGGLMLRARKRQMAA